MTAATDLRSLSVQDYHRMVKAGILAADERVELIEGQLYLVFPHESERIIVGIHFPNAL